MNQCEYHTLRAGQHARQRDIRIRAAAVPKKSAEPAPRPGLVLAIELDLGSSLAHASGSPA